MVKTFRVLIAALIVMVGLIGMSSSVGAEDGNGDMYFVDVPTGAVVAEILTLGATFEADPAESCELGSPRMVVGVDSNADGEEDAYIHGLLGPAEAVNNCAYADGTNLLDVGVFEFTINGQVGSYVGWDEVMAVAGDLPVTSVFLVDEAEVYGWPEITNPAPFATFSTYVPPTDANVTFTVLEGTTPVADATVVVYLDGVEAGKGSTDASGVLVLEALAADDYTYAVNKVGYEETTGSFTVVAGEDQDVKVQLTAVDTPTETETDTGTETETKTVAETESETATETESETATETETEAAAPVAVTSLPSTGSGTANGSGLLIAAAGAAALVAGAGIFRNQR